MPANPQPTNPSADNALRELAKFEEVVAACNRCGFCTSYCPTYKATGNEALAPRGRNQLVRALIEGKVWDAGQAAESIETCLLCGECTSVCFSEVPTAKLMVAARHFINRQRGVPRALQFVLKHLLPHPRRFSLFLRAGFIAKRLGLAWIARRTGLLERFAPALAAADEQLPRAPLRLLRDYREIRRHTDIFQANARHAEALAAQKTGAPAAPVAASVPTVAFFTACGPQFVRPGTGLATARLLERLKVNFVIPEVICCGLPAASYGVLDSVRDLARENIDRLEKGRYEAIIVDDSSCGAHLKDYAGFFEGDPRMLKRAHELAQKTRDIASFLVQKGLKDHLVRARWTGGPVAYHDPCKSQYAQKLTQPPRDLLSVIPNLKVVPIPEADQCCGGAGTFAVVHAELSREIAEAKVTNIIASGATIVVTSSVSCLLQVAAGLRRAGSKIEVLHLVDFLDRVLERRD
jgi:glycolate oxidase iron-sulfur subunit